MLVARSFDGRTRQALEFLVQHGLPVQVLIWSRPRKGERYEATLHEDGAIKFADGRIFRSPSGAAMAAAPVVSYDGWYAWRLGEDGPILNEVRHRIAERLGDENSG